MGIVYILLFILFHLFFEMEFCHIAKAGMELPGSRDRPALTSKSAGITGRATVPGLLIFILKINLLF